MPKQHFYIMAAGLFLMAAMASQGAPDWVQQTSHTSVKLGSVYFLDENRGFVAGDSGVVLKTSDGGVTWTQVPTGSAGGLMDISVIDTNLLYATVWDSGQVIKSSNGGNAWNELCTGVDTSDVSMGICFTSAQQGFACVGKNGYYNSRIIRTRDGGLHWDTVYNDGGNWVSYLNFPDPAHGYATASQGTILKTIDSGATWTALTPGNGAWMSGVFFLNKDTGYVSGAGGMVNNTYLYKAVFKTIDGGQSWETVNTDVVGVKLFFVNDSIGYLVGGDSMVIGGNYTATNFRLMKTQDGGSTWQRIYFGSGFEPYGVCFPCVNVGYVVGSSGAIYKFSGTTGPIGARQSSRCPAAGIDAVSFTRNNLHVRYSLSSEAREISFALYNTKGVCIWKGKCSDQSQNPGMHDAVLNVTRHVTAGKYVLTMSSINAWSANHSYYEKAVSWQP